MELPPLSASSEVARTTVVTNAVSAIIFREVLKPVAAALGPVGDVVLDRVIDGFFVRPKP